MKTWRKDFSIILFFLAVFSVSYGTPVTADASYSASCEAQAENLKDDCAALEALYDATGGGSGVRKPTGRPRSRFINGKESRQIRAGLQCSCSTPPA